MAVSKKPPYWITGLISVEYFCMAHVFMTVFCYRIPKIEVFGRNSHQKHWHDLLLSHTDSRSQNDFVDYSGFFFPHVQLWWLLFCSKEMRKKLLWGPASTAKNISRLPASVTEIITILCMSSVNNTRQNVGWMVPSRYTWHHDEDISLWLTFSQFEIAMQRCEG